MILLAKIVYLVLSRGCDLLRYSGWGFGFLLQAALYKGWIWKSNGFGAGRVEGGIRGWYVVEVLVDGFEG